MATATSRQFSECAPRRGALRGRLLLGFAVPVLLLGAGGAVLLELAAGGADFAGLPLALARAIFAGLILIALFAAAALALQTGDRFARPVAWMLRAIDAGQEHALSQQPPSTADWELGMLCNRVRVLLRQNRSGAKAMEELEALREEIGAVLRAASEGHLEAGHWPREDSTHELTRQLLTYFESQCERIRESAEGIDRLQGILEQDWRSQTQAVEELVKRAERAFLQQTQLAVEVERLERLFQMIKRELGHGSELEALLADLRLGIEHWQAEVVGHLDAAGYRAPQGTPVQEAAGGRDVTGRLRDWDAWVAASLQEVGEAQGRTRAQRELTLRRISAGLERVAEVVAGSGQEVGGLSQEVMQLQRAWGRLGERLRSLMVRVEEAHNGDRSTVVQREKEPGDDAGR